MFCNLKQVNHKETNCSLSNFDVTLEYVQVHILIFPLIWMCCHDCELAHWVIPSISHVPLAAHWPMTSSLKYQFIIYNLIFDII